MSDGDDRSYDDPPPSQERRPSQSTHRHPRRSRHDRLRLDRRARRATAPRRGHRYRSNGSKDPLDSLSSAQTAVTDTTLMTGCALSAASRRGHPIRRRRSSLCGNPNSLRLRSLRLRPPLLHSLHLGQLLLRPLHLAPLHLRSLLPVLFRILVPALLPPTR